MLEKIITFVPYLRGKIWPLANHVKKELKSILSLLLVTIPNLPFKKFV
jgi:hypothetical protein